MSNKPQVMAEAYRPEEKFMARRQRRAAPGTVEKADVQPFRLVNGGFSARAVVELASGAAARAGVRPGDRVIGLGRSGTE